MTRRTPFRSLALLGATVALGLAGCAADARQGDEDVDSDAQAVEEAEAHRPGRPPPFGPHMLIQTALEDLDLDDAQRRTIEADLAEMKPRARPEKATALAAAIRAGAIDPAKLAPSEMEERTAKNEVHTRVLASLAKLHQTLTPEQRSQLVGKVRTRLERAPAGPPPGTDGKHPHGRPGHLGFLLHGIDLDDAQRERIEAALEAASLPEPPPPPRPEDHRVEMGELLDAFAMATFDSKAIPEPPARAGRPPVLEALAVVVPLLDAEQREALAVRFERGPFGHPPPRR